MIRRSLAAAAAFLTLAFAQAAPAQTLLGGSATYPQSPVCGTVPVSVSCFDAAATWATTGTYVAPIRLNVTDNGPANAASLLLDLQVGGSSVFNVRKSGTLVMGPTLIMGASGTIQNSGNNASLVFGTDITLSNGSTSRIIDLATTGGFTSIVASPAILGFSTTAGNLTPDTRLARTAAGVLSFGTSGSTTGGTGVATGFQTIAVAVASLGTCNGAAEGTHKGATDANATFTAGIGAVVAAGGANHVPVYCDGTNWRIG